MIYEHLCTIAAQASKAAAVQLSAHTHQYKQQGNKHTRTSSRGTQAAGAHAHTYKQQGHTQTRTLTQVYMH